MNINESNNEYLSVPKPFVLYSININDAHLKMFMKSCLKRNNPSTTNVEQCIYNL
ncbi:hypothetical protein JHK82_049412 [Glycine max]|uniref:Uncharacterized protein n=2 Tax=Glycine subgen. Soja TaxID=1462606 RepID=K7MQ06_SOYBN|nr:hypothetical protein JHK86_049268 [Glycine max]KAG4923527.1 hypothetical protein JHK87_049067 [Glycine soja]KAG4935116.1 hypothetical protein JHK85_050035 [Glycine max]KAG5090634.1 hypothetical protein JHK82_049412 [Glycine max]KAG5093720.1 hypothetical protein JHK84_049308 [Glycine max]